MATLHVDTMPRTATASNGAVRKPVDSARRACGNRPIAPVCERIARDFERGVALRSIGKMYQYRVEVLEGILRDRLRELEAAMRRAGVVVAATGFLLSGAAIVDSYAAAIGDGAVVERSFRKSGRARKRGLEDSSALIELRQSAGVAA